ncbi:MAG: ATP-binding protein [Candidatus Woesearchaeota archaeon]
MALETILLERKLGSDLPETVANLIKKNNYVSIKEFIANAYDADASSVRITYDFDVHAPDGAELVIEDNGTGMDVKGLESFMRIGDSPKKQKQHSSGGRAVIGQFGVATLALHHLCSEYVLITHRDGNKFVVNEKFDDDLSVGRKVKAIKKKADSDLHGTKIIMRNLKFLPGEDYSIRDLRQHIEMGFLLDDSFQVFLNGEKLSWKVPDLSRSFEFKPVNGKRTGTVTGEIYYTNKSNPLAGVYVFVNSRRLEIDPQSLLPLAEIRPGFEHRIIAKLYADELNNRILFSRTGFMDDKIQEDLAKYVREALKPVKKWVENLPKQRSSENISKSLSSIVVSIENQLNSHLDFSRAISVELSDELDKAFFVPGIYNPSTGVVLLNKNYPGIRVTSDVNSVKYRSKLFDATIDSIAYELARRSNGDIEAYQKKKAELFEKLFPKSELLGINPEILPSAYYEEIELRKASGISKRTINYLLSANIISPNEQGRYLGKDWLTIQQKVSGMIPLTEVVQDFSVDVKSDDLTDKVATIIGRIKAIGDYAKPFITDISEDPNHPCYFVDQHLAKDVFDVLLQSRLNSTENNPAIAMKNFGRRQITESSLSKTFGISEEDVIEISNYAFMNNLPMHIERNRGRENYRLSDFVSAMYHKSNRGVN